MENENRKNRACMFCPAAEMCDAVSREKAPLHALAACAYANAVETTLRNDLKSFERGKPLDETALHRELSKTAAAALLVLQKAWELDETDGLTGFALRCEEIWEPYFNELLQRKNRR